MNMRGSTARIATLVAALVGTAIGLGPGGVRTARASDPPMVGLMRLTPGWDVFDVPLDYRRSGIVWTLDPSKKTLTVAVTLVGSTPTALHQISLHFFCKTFPGNFGQFQIGTTGDPVECMSITRQGVTRTVTGAEVAVVMTDRNGNGTTTVEIGPIAKGSYRVEYVVRSGAGCGVAGGGIDGPAQICPSIYQAPGATFGNTWNFTMP